MPLIETQKLSENTTLGIWQISEPIEWLLLTLKELNPEQEILIFKHQNRQLEWLASRVLVYLLLAQFTSEKLVVESDENGKPYFDNPGFHVSISQSGNYVAVLLSDALEVGIDIEIYREKVLKLAPKFLNEPEKAFAGNDLLKTCLCWSAKETLYKIYSRKKLLFKENILLEQFNNNAVNGVVMVNNFRQNYTVHYQKFPDFILTYCLHKPLEKPV